MQDIYAHIEDHLDESIAMLMDLVRQPSISAQGIGFDKAPGLVKQMFESAGLEVEIIPVPNDGNPVVLGTMDGASDRTLLFYTHYDVQPPEPLELWESDPFEPERRGDRLFGRGMSDDKGNIVARLAAIKAFRDTRGGLPCKVKFLAEGEEEIGSRNLRPVIAERGDDFKADACIWEGGGRNLNNDPFLYQGLKGVLTIDLRARQLSGDAHSSFAAILPSAPWRLVHALAAIRSAMAGFSCRGSTTTSNPLLRKNRRPRRSCPTRARVGRRPSAQTRSWVMRKGTPSRPTFCSTQPQTSPVCCPGTRARE